MSRLDEEVGVETSFDCDTCKLNGFYHNRNCQKFFPELVKEDRQVSWKPSYRTRKGTTYTIDDVGSVECPQSLVKGRLRWMISLVETQRSLVEVTPGSSFFGSDLLAWPAWAVDLFTLVQQQRIQVDNARHAAEMEELG